MDRRSIHRAVKDLDIMVEPLKKESLEMEEYAEHLVHQTIRSALEEYKEIIQPQKMEKIYQEVPALSRNIAKIFHSLSSPGNRLSWNLNGNSYRKP